MFPMVMALARGAAWNGNDAKTPTKRFFLQIFR
jgi:hypothetical protein